MKNYISKITLLLFFTFVSGSIQIVLGQETLNKDETTATTTEEDGIEYVCFECTEEFSMFEPIVNRGPLPRTFTFKLPAGGKVNLGGRYADADAVIYQGGCPITDVLFINTPKPLQCIGEDGHSVRFTITEGMNRASFDAIDENIDEISKNSIRITSYEPYTRLFGSDFGDFQSENAELNTSLQWNQGDIEVEITIIDNAPLPPPINQNFVRIGSCQDPNLELHTFTIERDNNIPTEIGLLENSPMDDTWVDMLHIINDQRSYFEEYFYRPLESCEEDGNGYEGHIITESFLNAVPLFTLNDLSEEWRIDEEIMTLDQAALKIFPKSLVPPPAASFSVENDIIGDFHGFSSPFSREFIRDEIFDEGATAIANNIIGYRLNQEYRTADAASTLLGTASIDRALRLTPLQELSWFIKKSHAGICLP